MPLFGKSHKSPADIVKALKDNLSILVKQDKKTEKVNLSFLSFVLVRVILLLLFLGTLCAKQEGQKLMRFKLLTK